MGAPAQAVGNGYTIDPGLPLGLSGLQVGNAWAYRSRCPDDEVKVLQERVGSAGGVGGALQVERCVDGGLDVRCRPSDGFFTPGGLLVVGEDVAFVPGELKMLEFLS